MLLPLTRRQREREREERGSVGRLSGAVPRIGEGGGCGEAPEVGRAPQVERWCVTRAATRVAYGQGAAPGCEREGESVSLFVFLLYLVGSQMKGSH